MPPVRLAQPESLSTATFVGLEAMLTLRQADALTEEQVSEFKEAFSLFVRTLLPLLALLPLVPLWRSELTCHTTTGQGW